MGDWLKTFGLYSADLPPDTGVDGFYIPTNRKSLVVSSILPFHTNHVEIIGHRYPFSLLVLSLERF